MAPAGLSFLSCGLLPRDCELRGGEGEPPPPTALQEKREALLREGLQMVELKQYVLDEMLI